VTDEKRSHGPGFRLGLLIGLVAGLAAAVLFAPPTGEEEPRIESGATSAGTMPEGSPADRATSLLEQVRRRVQEAAREAEIAAREAEAQAQARYMELTQRKGSEN
jgi:hypothetical protein